jgi:hypothetical protein
VGDDERQEAVDPALWNGPDEAEDCSDEGECIDCIDGDECAEVLESWDAWLLAEDPGVADGPENPDALDAPPPGQLSASSQRQRSLMHGGPLHTQTWEVKSKVSPGETFLQSTALPLLPSWLRRKLFAVSGAPSFSQRQMSEKQ